MFLSLNVPNISNKTGNLIQLQKEKNVQLNSTPISTPSPATKSVKADKSNDGKFSFIEAAKNFAKGIISPITSMFESKKNFLIGAATIVGSGVLVVATGGAITPLLIAAGVTMGALQGAKGVYKLATAKNGDDVEKAFYDVGGATGAVGLSVLGAKGSLDSAAIKTRGLNAFSSTSKCFTSAKAQAVESFNTFKNGYFKTNLSNFIKPFFQPKVYKQYSKQFTAEGHKNFAEAYKEIFNVLPKKVRHLLKGRAKSEQSIYSKILDECIMKEKIQKTMKRTDLTEAQKSVEITNLKNKEAKYLIDINAARKVVNDLIGTRLVLEDASPEAVSRLVTSLVNGIKNDKISISEIRNYRGPNGQFYFSNDHIISLKSAVAEKGKNLTVLEGKKQIKSSGYNAVQLKIDHKNGSLGELQIRGKVVDKVADFEHVPYDLKTGKDISRGSNKIGDLLSPFKKAVDSMSETEYAEYEKYLARSYRHARRQEMDLPSRHVELPKTFNEILSTENLHKLHEQTLHLHSKDTPAIALAPQSAVSYSFLKLTNGD